MPRAGPRRIYKYSRDFKLAAVRLSQQADLQVQAVAVALAIHPFMLSRWRKEFREGRLRPGTPTKPRAPKARLVREIQRLQDLERAHALLQEAPRLTLRGS